MDIIGWFPNDLESKLDAVCSDFVNAAAATAVCPDATAARRWKFTCKAIQQRHSSLDIVSSVLSGHLRLLEQLQQNQLALVMVPAGSASIQYPASAVAITTAAPAPAPAVSAAPVPTVPSSYTGVLLPPMKTLQHTEIRSNMNTLQHTEHGFAAPALRPAVAALAAPAAASPAAHQGGVRCTSAAAPGQPIHTVSSFPVRTLAAALGQPILNAPRTKTPVGRRRRFPTERQTKRVERLAVAKAIIHMLLSRKKVALKKEVYRALRSSGDGNDWEDRNIRRPWVTLFRSPNHANGKPAGPIEAVSLPEVTSTPDQLLVKYGVAQFDEIEVTTWYNPNANFMRRKNSESEVGDVAGMTDMELGADNVIEDAEMNPGARYVIGNAGVDSGVGYEVTGIMTDNMDLEPGTGNGAGDVGTNRGDAIESVTQQDTEIRIEDAEGWPNESSNDGWDIPATPAFCSSGTGSNDLSKSNLQADATSAASVGPATGSRVLDPGTEGSDAEAGPAAASAAGTVPKKFSESAAAEAGTAGAERPESYTAGPRRRFAPLVRRALSPPAGAWV